MASSRRLNEGKLYLHCYVHKNPIEGSNVGAFSLNEKALSRLILEDTDDLEEGQNDANESFGLKNMYSQARRARPKARPNRSWRELARKLAR